eukprot:364086-Chlamydomonas_euryale.AAC.1
MWAPHLRHTPALPPEEPPGDAPHQAADHARATLHCIQRSACQRAAPSASCKTVSRQGERMFYPGLTRVKLRGGGV